MIRSRDRAEKMSRPVAFAGRPTHSPASLAAFRGWRDMKGVLWLRPVFHHREDRIRSHIQLCWLALLFIRVVENGVGDSWRNVRHELDRMHLVTLETAEGRVAQRSATTPGQTKTLKAVELAEAARFLDFEPRRPPLSPRSRARVATRPCGAIAPILPDQTYFLRSCVPSNPVSPVRATPSDRPPHTVTLCQAYTSPKLLTPGAAAQGRCVPLRSLRGIGTPGLLVRRPIPFYPTPRPTGCE